MLILASVIVVIKPAVEFVEIFFHGVFIEEGFAVVFGTSSSSSAIPRLRRCVFIVSARGATPEPCAGFAARHAQPQLAPSKPAAG